MYSLKGKIAVVTGGTSGIGYATVQKLWSEGATVYACARHERDYAQKGIYYHTLDVTSEESCRALYDDVLREQGKVDILVANAGITADALTAKMSEEDFDNVINTNLKGIFHIVRLFGPLMEQQGEGAIITVSSIVGEYGNIGQANYAASKAGIIGMSKSWAREFARKGKAIRVNVVAPGYILTDMLSTVPTNLLEKFQEKTMLKRLGRPEEIANVIAFLASEEASYITGAVLDVNGGMTL